MVREKEKKTAGQQIPAPGEEKDLHRKDSLLRQLTGSDEEDGMGLLVRNAVAGEFLAGKWFRRQLGFIALLVFLALLYTSLRYACQKEVSIHQHLCDTLLDRQYKALTISSEFKERTRGSRIEEQLTDSTLHSPSKPLFTLPVSEGKRDNTPSQHKTR